MAGRLGGRLREKAPARAVGPRSPWAPAADPSAAFPALQPASGSRSPLARGRPRRECN